VKRLQSRQHPRSGYALLLVVTFIAIVFSIAALCHRQLVSVLRNEHARELRVERDTGSLNVAAQAIDLLETGDPPTDPYVCTTTVDFPQGTRTYVVTFTNIGFDDWTVDVIRDDSASAPTMPGSF
jgi:hypothetical protein